MIWFSWIKDKKKDVGNHLYIINFVPFKLIPRLKSFALKKKIAIKILWFYRQRLFNKHKDALSNKLMQVEGQIYLI